MRTTSIVILAIVLFASTNALTSQDIIRAVNFARKNPLIIRDRIKATYPDPGRGTDLTCYSDAQTFLTTQPSLPPLVESAAADYSSWKQSKYCVTVNGTITHYGEGGSTPKTRLDAVGTFDPSWATNENIAVTYRQNTIYPAADEFVMMWITDCGVPKRGHRLNIYDASVTQQGCGVFQGPMTKSGISYTGTVVTCAGAKGLAIKEETKVKLAEASLSLDKNDVGFTGV